MEGFKIKLKTLQVDFELEVDGVTEEDKDFIREIMGMVDRKTSTSLENLAREEKKERYKKAKEGYNVLSNDIQGFHNGIDEFIVQEIVQEEEESQNDKEIEKDTETSSEEVQVKPIESKDKDKLDVIQLDDKEKVVNESDNDNDGKVKVSTTRFYTETDDPSIKLNLEGKEIYQLYYICSKCKFAKKRFVPRYAIYTTCHSCSNKMRIKPASLKGFPNKDKYRNIFAAGDFKPNESTQPDNDSTINDELSN